MAMFNFLLATVLHLFLAAVFDIRLFYLYQTILKDS